MKNRLISWIMLAILLAIIAIPVACNSATRAHGADRPDYVSITWNPKETTSNSRVGITVSAVSYSIGDTGRVTIDDEECAFAFAPTVIDGVTILEATHQTSPYWTQYRFQFDRTGGHIEFECSTYIESGSNNLGSVWGSISEGQDLIIQGVDPQHKLYLPNVVR